MNKKKKYILLGFLIISFCTLMGAGRKSMELLNDYKLIDLKAAIELTLPGTADMGASKKPDDEAKENKNKNEEESVKPSKTARTFVVRIKDEQIKYNGQEIESIEKLINILEQECNFGDIIILTDDYAEAHAYRNVRQKLEELVKRKSVVLTEG